MRRHYASTCDRFLIFRCVRSVLFVKGGKKTKNNGDDLEGDGAECYVFLKNRTRKIQNKS